ncbi:unnamed protein product [Amoebophrya sp. A25]|nr:unnamed protein product [Amoebophrya sp. A25]|eukprot:GSA25T00009181001.1
MKLDYNEHEDEGAPAPAPEIDQGTSSASRSFIAPPDAEQGPLISLSALLKSSSTPGAEQQQDAPHQDAAEDKVVDTEDHTATCTILLSTSSCTRTTSSSRSPSRTSTRRLSPDEVDRIVARQLRKLDLEYAKVAGRKPTEDDGCSLAEDEEEDFDHHQQGGRGEEEDFGHQNVDYAPLLGGDSSDDDEAETGDGDVLSGTGSTLEATPDLLAAEGEIPRRGDFFQFEEQMMNNNSRVSDSKNTGEVGLGVERTSRPDKLQQGSSSSSSWKGGACAPTSDFDTDFWGGFHSASSETDDQGEWESQKIPGPPKNPRGSTRAQDALRTTGADEEWATPATTTSCEEAPAEDEAWVASVKEAMAGINPKQPSRFLQTLSDKQLLRMLAARK